MVAAQAGLSARLGREKDHVFPWSSVRRFGEDIILVEEAGREALETGRPDGKKQEKTVAFRGRV